ncbi:MAG: hypothetical protein LBI67_07035 [Treponema sp.]|nr:hypothetical protein [Treponema sp.]
MKKNRVLAGAAIAVLAAALVLTGCGKKETRSASALLKTLDGGDGAALEKALAP